MTTVSPEIVERVRMEYLEMPGLALTCGQARRLLNLDAAVCEHILAELVRENFLSRNAHGVFLRRAAGPHLFRARPFDVAASPEPRTV
jgi:hypothetical protein